MASAGLLKAGGPVWSVLEEWARVVRVRRVMLASPRSWCAGEERAIEVVEALLERYAGTGRPVFTRRTIVHKAHVVQDLESRGAVFVQELDEVPDGVVVFSADGVSPAVREEPVRRGIEVVGATCLLVTKVVHVETCRFACRADTVVLVGHAAYKEVEGILGGAPVSMVLVESVEDVAEVEVADPVRVPYLLQTTLALDETSRVIAALEKPFPCIRGPGSDDICCATTNRYHVLTAVATRSDVVLVVGSVNSNSQRLVEVARRGGRPACLIDDAGQIRPEWIERADMVGLTAGASGPQWLVDEVVAAPGGLGPLTVAEHTTLTATVTHCGRR